MKRSVFFYGKMFVAAFVCVFFAASCATEPPGNRALLTDGALAAAKTNENFDEVMRRAVFYENAGDLNNALASYKIAAAIRPSDPMPYYGLGNIYLKGRVFDLAKSNFSKAIALNPGIGLFHNGLAWTYLEMGLPVSAKEHALRGFDLDFERRYMYSEVLGAAELALGNFFEAEKHLKDAITAAPAMDFQTQFRLYSRLRDIYTKTGDKGKVARVDGKLDMLRRGMMVILDF